jgi:hypothetical protein
VGYLVVPLLGFLTWIKEIEAGVGFDLKTVLAEADEMLAE